VTVVREPRRFDIARGDVYQAMSAPRFHFVRDLPSEIAVRRASRAAGAQVMHKCCAKNPGFYEVCEATLHHGTPGASIF
jgi:hypothetical protein